MTTKDQTSIFRALPGYPWLDPCPRCWFRGDSCDCTVRERAMAAHPGLHLLGYVTDNAERKPTP
jgi:hypothetical protein